MTTHRLFYLVKFKLETSVLNWSSLYLTLFWCNCLGNCHLILSLPFMACTKLMAVIDSEITCLFPAANKHRMFISQCTQQLRSTRFFYSTYSNEIWATACKSRKSLRQMVCLPCVIWLHSNSCTEPMKLQPDSWNLKNLFNLQLESSKRKWNEVFWKNC